MSDQLIDRSATESAEPDTAFRDGLTGVLSRTAGRATLRAEVDRALRLHEPLSLALVVVEGLERVNAEHGRAYGDSLLVAVATALRHNLRIYDIVARDGGSTFLCGFPGGTDQVARHVIDRVRHQLTRIVPGGLFSAGVAALLPGDALDDLVRRADRDIFGARPLKESRPTAGQNSAGDPEEDRLSFAVSPTVACGSCGGRLPLPTFVVAFDDAMTRFADCPDCGETTVIQVRQGSVR